MTNFTKCIQKFKRIQHVNEYIPTKKMYDDIIIFLTSRKADEKYSEQMRNNWKYGFLNILIGI